MPFVVDSGRSIRWSCSLGLHPDKPHEIPADARCSRRRSGHRKIEHLLDVIEVARQSGRFYPLTP